MAAADREKLYNRFSELLKGDVFGYGDEMSAGNDGYRDILSAGTIMDASGVSIMPRRGRTDAERQELIGRLLESGESFYVYKKGEDYPREVRYNKNDGKIYVSSSPIVPSPKNPTKKIKKPEEPHIGNYISNFFRSMVGGGSPVVRSWREYQHRVEAYKFIASDVAVQRRARVDSAVASRRGPGRCRSNVQAYQSLVTELKLKMGFENDFKTKGTVRCLNDLMDSAMICDVNGEVIVAADGKMSRGEQVEALGKRLFEDGESIFIFKPGEEFPHEISISANGRIQVSEQTIDKISADDKAPSWWQRFRDNSEDPTRRNPAVRRHELAVMRSVAKERFASPEVKSRRQRYINAKSAKEMDKQPKAQQPQAQKNAPVNEQPQAQQNAPANEQPQAQQNVPVKEQPQQAPADIMQQMMKQMAEMQAQMLEMQKNFNAQMLEMQKNHSAEMLKMQEKLAEQEKSAGEIAVEPEAKENSEPEKMPDGHEKKEEAPAEAKEEAPAEVKEEASEDKEIELDRLSAEEIDRKLEEKFGEKANAQKEVKAEPEKKEPENIVEPAVEEKNDMKLNSIGDLSSGEVNAENNAPEERKKAEEPKTEAQMLIQTLEKNLGKEVSQKVKENITALCEGADNARAYITEKCSKGQNFRATDQVKSMLAYNQMRQDIMDNNFGAADMEFFESDSCREVMTMLPRLSGRAYYMYGHSWAPDKFEERILDQKGLDTLTDEYRNDVLSALKKEGIEGELSDLMNRAAKKSEERLAQERERKQNAPNANRNRENSEPSIGGIQAS